MSAQVFTIAKRCLLDAVLWGVLVYDDSLISLRNRHVSFEVGHHVLGEVAGATEAGLVSTKVALY